MRGELLVNCLDTTLLLQHKRNVCVHCLLTTFVCPAFRVEVLTIRSVNTYVLIAFGFITIVFAVLLH